MRTKCIRGISLIMNTQLLPKVISCTQVSCVQWNESINQMLGHGIELKSLHLDTDSDWKNPDGRYKSEVLKKVREKVEYQIKHINAPQNTRFYLMRFLLDGFQPCWSQCLHHPFNYSWWPLPMQSNSQQDSHYHLC